METPKPPSLTGAEFSLLKEIKQVLLILNRLNLLLLRLSSLFAIKYDLVHSSLKILSKD